MNRPSALVIGAGPAGLTAAYELARRGVLVEVCEASTVIGGLARTESYKGYYFDIGGHRFLTKVHEIDDLWDDLLSADLLKVSRLSRIYYDGRFFNYPLDLSNTLRNLGIRESTLIMLSYLRSRVRPLPDEETFEQWMTNRFGDRLYRMFFKTYTEKLWGIPCSQIQADWAAQRIRGLSVASVITNALFRTNHVKTLANGFLYPRLGPGMMWERLRERIEGLGGLVRTDAEVVRLRRAGDRVTAAEVRIGGQTLEISADHFISSMPLTELVRRLDPLPPDAVVEAADALSYRAFIIVGLILGRDDLFPDNWVYVHSADVLVGRIQNFGNWSSELVPDPQTASLGLEYFCDVGDSIWSRSDQALVELAGKELQQLGLGRSEDVIDGVVFRQPQAYPIYDGSYREQVATIREFLGSLSNLQTIGRNGMHRYNNMDHSMLTGLLASRNVLGERHDLWRVNTEQSYYEEIAAE